MHLLKNLGLRLLIVILGVFGIAAFTGIIVVVGVRFLNAIQHTLHLTLEPVVLRYGNRLLTPAYDFLHAHAPLTIHGADMAPYMIAAVLLVVCVVCDHAIHRVSVFRLAMVERQKAAQSAEAALIVATDAPDQLKRDEVLQLYAQTKKILDAQKRSLAFLAADVVNSTSMKQGEDPALAELDFRNYRKLVEEIMAARKSLKAAWTPDGVMICFASAADAVAAGQDLILGLEKFNREVKAMKADFKVRCGVNVGEVLYDDSVKMEEMADGSIDLAGHLQKSAAPDSIYVAASLVETLPSKQGFRPADAQVDGVAVCEWRRDFARAATN